MNETEIRKDSVKISWEAPESGAEVAQYAVFLNGKQVARVDAAITEYIFTGLNAGTEYTVAVQAIGTNGEVSGTVEMKVTTADDDKKPTEDDQSRLIRRNRPIIRNHLTTKLPEQQSQEPRQLRPEMFPMYSFRE